MNATLFAMASYPHSGTHFVMMTVSAHPLVAFYDEILNPNPTKWCGPLHRHLGVMPHLDRFWGLRPWAQSLGQLPSKMEEQCMRSLLGRRRNASLDDFDRRIAATRARGFTWHNSHGWNRLEHYANDLRRRRVKLIILKRTNIIAMAIAKSGAKQAPPPVQQPAGRRMLRASIGARIATASKVLAETGKLFEKCRQLRIPAMSVTYELLLDDPSAFVDIFRFLNLGEGVRWDKSRQSLVGSGWEYHLDSATRWHTKPPLEYIPASQHEEVRATCRRSSGCEVCMLDGTCPKRTVQRDIAYT